MDVTQIGAVLLYVSPGFLAVQLRYFLVPGRKGSDFELLAWSIFLSVLGYLAACAVAVPICGSTWREVADPARREFTAAQWLFTLTFGLTFATVTTSPSTTRLLRWIGIEHSPFPSVWNEVWQRPEGAPWVKVRMTDGSLCCGAVVLYTRDPAEAQREILLYPVFMLDGNERPTEEISGVATLVRGDQIASVEILDFDESLLV